MRLWSALTFSILASSLLSSHASPLGWGRKRNTKTVPDDARPGTGLYRMLGADEAQPSVSDPKWKPSSVPPGVPAGSYVRKEDEHRQHGSWNPFSSASSTHTYYGGYVVPDQSQFGMWESIDHRKSGDRHMTLYTNRPGQGVSSQHSHYNTKTGYRSQS